MEQSNGSLLNLQLYWTRFLHCDNDEKKVKWLELFLFEYNNKLIQTDNVQLCEKYKFLSSVPSQLTCYILQLVYGIICASITPLAADPSELENDKNVTISSENFVIHNSSNCNGAGENGDIINNVLENAKKINVTKSNDITTIVALRDFLIDGIGGRILEILLHLNTRNLLCSRELANLLVNLFPTSRWENVKSILPPKEIIIDFETLSNAMETLTKTNSYDENLNFEKKSFKKVTSDSFQNGFHENCMDEIFDNPQDYYNDEYKKFATQTFTCDYIASIVLNLIIKLILEENNLNMDRDSITVLCLQFAVECYANNRNSDAFTLINTENLQRRLLTIICMCFNNIFESNRKYYELIDISPILRKLLGCLVKCDVGKTADTPVQVFAIKFEHISALIYLIFLLLLKIMSKAEEQMHIFYHLFDLMKSNWKNIDTVLNDLVVENYCANNTTILNITDVMCRLISAIRRFDNIYHKRRSRRRRIEQRMCTHHHHNTDEFGCVLENILLKILQKVDAKCMNKIFKFVKKNPICCCNNDLQSVELILNNAKQCITLKNCLKFIKDNFLKNLYSNIECKTCDGKRIGLDIGYEFISMYSNWANTLESQDLIIFLKHIVKIAKYLPFDISFKIFSDVVLPPFRREKEKIMNENLSEIKVQQSKDIIVCCLNIFLCYLKDIRLIKGFYNIENLQHMCQLIVVPEFASLICCLLKIGIDNLSFLGENCEEQLLMAKQLNDLQVEIIENVCAILIVLFEEIGMVKPIQLEIGAKIEKMSNDGINHNLLLKLIQTKQLSIQNILHLCVVYWNLILQLFRSNGQLKTSFQHSLRQYPGIVFQFVYNSLSCYLYINQHCSTTISNDTDNELLNEYSLLSTYSICENCPLKNVNLENSIDLSFTDHSCNISDSSKKRSGIFSLNVDFEKIVPDENQLVQNKCKHLSGTSSFERPNNYIFNVSNDYNSTNLQLLNIANDDHELQTESNLLLFTAQKLHHFLNTSVYNILFSKTNSEEDYHGSSDDFSANKINSEPTVFQKNELIQISTVEYKKLFLQLFEITLGIMMSEENKEINDTKMSSKLKVLKSLLMQHSFDIINSDENGKLIINALQSLLKVAEMRYNCCFIEKCSHSTYARRSRYALSTSFDVGYQCCDPSNNVEDEEHPSELEQSEEDSTSDENYLTADEGYDGDAEHISHNDSDVDELNLNISPAPITSRYRTQIIHEGICRIVIDILIDLSKRCIQNPHFWPNYLMQIATRFTAIKESIGGSLHLIKGFAPVLKSNDIRLKDFQKSILELITDVNTPETLSAYLNILTSDTAPVELLLPRLVYLGGFSRRVQPSFEIEFPTENDESMKTTCDPVLVKDIKQIHDYHHFHNLRTAFTQSSYIIPLNYINFNPWNQNGFTVTTWIKLKPPQNRDRLIDEPPINEHDENGSRKKCTYICDMSHMFSIGTNKLLLSIYISSNDSNTLHFQLSKPSAQITDHKIPNISRSNVDNFNIPKKTQTPCVCLFRRKRRVPMHYLPYNQEVSLNMSKNENAENLSNTPATAIPMPIPIPTVTIEDEGPQLSRKNSIKSSLNPFSFFTSDTNEDDSNVSSFRHPVELKGLRLPKNKWTHFSFSVGTSLKELSISVTINGVKQHTIHLPYTQTNKGDKFQLLCIGQKKQIADSDDVSHFDQDLPYSLSNICIFRKCIINPTVLAQLVTLGPDCIDFTQCQINNILPNIGFLNQQKIFFDFDAQIMENFQFLHNNIIAVYSAHNPDILLGYNRLENDGIGENMGLITLGKKAETKHVHSLQTAVVLCGGLSALLYLFARVVEMSNSEFIQSMALSFLLRTAHSNAILYTEFVRRDYINLIGPIIRSDKCIKSIHLLNSVLETACDLPILTTRSDAFSILHSTQACIVYPKLLISIINHYSDWQTGADNESDILDFLFGGIQALVREKHPKQSLNIMRFTAAGIVPALLDFCKIYLVGVPQPVHLSNKAADLLVSLVGTFAGAPPSSSLLDDLTKVLLLLHRPSDSFITHDRSKFYFLLSSTAMVKQKRLSLPISTRNLGLNVKRERKNTTPIKHVASATKIQRSISLDNPKVSDEFNSKVFFRKRLRSQDEDKASLITETSELEPNEENVEVEAVDEVDNKENNTPPSKVLQKSSLQGLNNKIDDRTLESIADCSRLNGNGSLKMLNLNGSTKLDKALLNMQIKRQTAQKKRINRKKRQRAANRNRNSTSSETDTSRIASISESVSGIDEDMVQDYVIIAADDIKKIEESFRLRNAIGRNEFEFKMTSDGVVQTQIGFFNLLKDFILILPDSSIQEVLTHFVTFDVILVMSNHPDQQVRTAILRLISVMCGRLSKSAITQYTKSFYWHHLANQIALHRADLMLIQICAQWITGSCLTLEQIVYEQKLKVVETYGLNTLIALIPQTVHDAFLTKLIIKFVEKIYKLGQESRQYLIENGLIPTVIKYLPKFYDKWGTTNEKSLKYMHRLLITIAQIALLSTGTMNVIWDLLNGLAFVEENRNKMIFRGLRITQAIILLELFEIFVPENKGPLTDNFKLNATLFNSIDCSLSLSERKTRFDLLIDRIVQFITNAEPSHIPTEQEVKLIHYIVLLSVNGYQKGSNVIPWSLCPSRPLTLKMFIIKTLCKYIKKGQLPTLGCDGKVVKALTQSFFETDRDILEQSDLDALMIICNVLGISLIIPCNISQTLEKLQLLRAASLKDQKPAVQRTVFKFEPIVQSCIDSAMKTTRDVVELQNMERRVLMNRMRSYDESGMASEWKLLINRVSHEGAPWHCAATYSNSWELDQTEGPSRVRVRFRRCQLDVDSKFLLSESDEKSPIKNQLPALSYLNESLVQRPNFALNDQVLYTFTCKHLPIDNEIDGEIIITESHLIFLANNIKHDPINIEISTITEIWLRRYQHQENALEFFLETNNSKLFIFQNTTDRLVLVRFFFDKVVQCPDAPKLNIVTQQWSEGQLTNWEYLTILNQISGRTYQDLMQYPIFPWILSDYENAVLNLNSIETFRNLYRPIAVQNKENMNHFINNYEYLSQALPASGNCQMAPYHYGSHYSNSGTVLHFLVRIPPFTKFFLRYQDDNFDLPDRTFHSIKTTWRLASKDSPTDVKELIPEFFYLPEIFENSEGFNFGYRQSGELVNHVSLPKWASESSRMFILIHRQALECNLVRMNLHKWIDLIFGYKQTGSAAVEAINVFHPSTYIGFSASGILDPVEKMALETMVRTYGQMPKQLFTEPHSSSTVKQLLENQQNNVNIYSTVKGLRWGIYTGSPQLDEPKVCNFYQQFDIIFNDLITLGNTNVLYGVPKGCNVMQGCDADTMNLILWNENDGVVRIKPFCDENIKPQSLIQNLRIDEISACGTDPQSNQLWFGHKSGRITVYECLCTTQNQFNKNRFFQHSSFSSMSYNSAFRKYSSKDIDKYSEGSDCKTLRWKVPVTLIRHTNEITAIQISKEFKIVISVGKDGLTVIWDLNRLQYIRCIQDFCKTPISLLAISPTLGDIVTIHSLEGKESMGNNSDDESASDCLEATENIDDFVKVPVNLIGKSSLMRLHTINAKYVNHVMMTENVHAICYSHVKEGTAINVIATGIDDGIIRLWSSWDLTLIREIHIGKVNVISLKYSTYQHLVALTSDNVIQVWESPGLQGNTPKFPQIVFHKRSSV